MPSVQIIVNTAKFNWRIEDDSHIFLNDKHIEPNIVHISEHEYSILLNGRSYHVISSRNDKHHVVYVNNNKYDVTIENPSDRFLRSILENPVTRQGMITEVRAPMPGLVVNIEVAQGHEVKAGDGLLILEAMKMENEIKAVTGGIIKKILVDERQAVEKNQLLIEIE